MQNIAGPLPWQTDLWVSLEERRLQNKLPHALLFTGPAGVGKRHFAQIFANRLLCLDSSDGLACGRCKACELLAAGSHPDLRLIEPPEGKQIIGVDQVRGLGDFLSRTAQQGGWKVAILNPADAMNLNSANALLKNLEEPAGKALLILVSQRAALLPATIRSRCQRIAFGHPASHLAKTWLIANPDVQDAALAGQALQVAEGAPLRALRLLREDTLKQRQEFEQLLAQVASGQRGVMEAVRKCESYDQQSSLDWFQTFVMRLVSNAAGDPGSKALFGFLDKLLEARRWVASPANLNRQLLWEELMFDWQQARRTR